MVCCVPFKVLGVRMGPLFFGGRDLVSCHGPALLHLGRATGRQAVERNSLHAAHTLDHMVVLPLRFFPSPLVPLLGRRQNFTSVNYDDNAP